MKQFVATLIALTLVLGCKSGEADRAAPTSQPLNTLSRAEKKAGFQLLFDGNDLSQWRSYQKQEVKGWAAEDGLLVCTGGGGDLITREQFRSFEFECEWKIPPKGNSGIIYRFDESGKQTWFTGPEYQLWDHSQSP